MPKRTLQIVCTIALTLPILAATGCHSAFVNVTLANHSNAATQLLEVDYPSASFGTSSLAPGAVFHYRFKVLGEGPTKLSWTDAAGKDHTSTGPALHEGQEGNLQIEFTATGVSWHSALHP